MSQPRRALLAGVGVLLALVACGATIPPITRVPFEAVRCPDSGMACDFVEGGGIGCCARGADGVAASWMCPPNLGGRSVARPQPIAGLIGAVHVEPHDYGVCARLSDGTVRCFGSNDRGALGLGYYRAMDAITAVGLQELWGSDRGQLKVGEHRCARAPDGTVRCWRADEPPPPIPRCRPVAHDVAVYASCEGLEPRALCRGTAVALPVVGIDAATALFGRCALQGGELFCWGDNSHGELRTPKASYAIPVATPLGDFGDAIASVEGHCAVLAEDGRVTCWGGAAQSPARTLAGVDQLAFTSRYGGSGCALAYGQVHCWGKHGSMEVVRVAGLGRAVQIGVSGSTGCALLEDETVSCWGRNHHGQLGDGTTQDSDRPVRVQAISDVKQLEVGLFSACALLADGGVACWGSLPTDDGYADHPTPVRVEGLPRAVRVAVEGNTFCAIAESTRVYCWGDVHVPEDPVLRDASAAPPVTSQPAVPGSIAEDVALRPLPAPPSISCSTRSVYCLGEGSSCHASEDECLDQRALSKPPRASCKRRETTHVSQPGVSGARFCACRGDRCRRCPTSTEAFERCSELPSNAPCGAPDWETGEPVPDAELTKRCDSSTVALDAPPSKAPARYCAMGGIAQPRSCPAPPPNAGPGYCPDLWSAEELCFRSLKECEAFRTESAQHLPQTTAQQCTRVAP